ncbi:hypothetical protein JZ751_027295 [Albula glossodonta]|uniref:Uncharacterized protein n=1 Tax=Albula glossodonta TaxID=121402 RepID=A0A8T2NK33_9TELE|nr:hypothetical protein JZ751_027295 [Albula glossodonta]
MANPCCPICRRTVKDIIKTYRSTWDLSMGLGLTADTGTPFRWVWRLRASAPPTPDPSRLSGLLSTSWDEAEPKEEFRRTAAPGLG